MSKMSKPYPENDAFLVIIHLTMDILQKEMIEISTVFYNFSTKLMTWTVLLSKENFQFNAQ